VPFLRGLVVEVVATFLLMTAVMALAVDDRAPTGWAGLVIGLAVACAILVAGPLTGGSLNPARSLGPLVGVTAGGEDAPWEDLPLYLLGPMLGATLAAVAYATRARPAAVAPEPLNRSRTTEEE